VIALSNGRRPQHQAVTRVRQAGCGAAPRLAFPSSVLADPVSLDLFTLLTGLGRSWRVSSGH